MESERIFEFKSQITQRDEKILKILDALRPKSFVVIFDDALVVDMAKKSSTMNFAVCASNFAKRFSRI